MHHAPFVGSWRAGIAVNDMIEQRASDVVDHGALEIEVFSIMSSGTTCDTACVEPTFIDVVGSGEQFLLQVTVPFSEASWMKPVFCSGVEITVRVMMRHE